MKILYAVQKTGNGHVARAQEIIPILQKFGCVDILASGNQSQIELPFDVKYNLKGISLVYNEKGEVSYWKTFLNNNYWAFLKDIIQLKTKKYDLIINDFEPVSAWASLFKGGNIISLSHQAALFFNEVPKPKKRALLAQFILKYYAPCRRKYGFHFKNYHDKIFTPVIREKIRNLKSETIPGNYIVYLPSFSDAKLIKTLSKINGNWHIYSKYASSNYTINNCSVYPINEEDFLFKLSHCEGVLCNAGFELPAEALYLKKKLVVIPIKKQIEQEYNAIALKKLGVLTLKQLDQNLISIWSKSDSSLSMNFSKDIEAILKEIISENVSITAETTNYHFA